MSTATVDITTKNLARRAGIALGLAALLAIAGFTALGSAFEYPQILAEPVDDILALFRAHQAPVMFWFGVLVISAALMAPAGIWIGRVLIATGVVIPIVAAASLSNFAGYVVWCVWLLAVAVILVRDLSASSASSIDRQGSR